MIHTNKDIEVVIESLKREIHSLKVQINNLRTNGTSTSPTSSTQVTTTEVRIRETDSELSSDATNVLHRLRHIFDEMAISDLDVTNLVVSDVATIRELLLELLKIYSTEGTHIELADNSLGNNACSVLVSGDNLHLCSGARFDGTNWIATNTTAMILVLNRSLGVKVYYNSGLTIGTGFGPTSIATLSTAADLTINNLICVDITASDDLSVAGDATVTGNLTVSTDTFSRDYYGRNINLTGGYFLASVPGVTEASFSLISNLAVNTINYKDHLGANQSMIVVTGASAVKNLAFSGGIRTT